MSWPIINANQDKSNKPDSNAKLWAEIMISERNTCSCLCLYQNSATVVPKILNFFPQESHANRRFVANHKSIFSPSRDFKQLWQLIRPYCRKGNGGPVTGWSTPWKRLLTVDAFTFTVLWSLLCGRKRNMDCGGGKGMLLGFFVPDHTN